MWAVHWLPGEHGLPDARPYTLLSLAGSSVAEVMKSVASDE